MSHTGDTGVGLPEPLVTVVRCDWLCHRCLSPMTHLILRGMSVTVRCLRILYIGDQGGPRTLNLCTTSHSNSASLLSENRNLKVHVLVLESESF